MKSAGGRRSAWIPDGGGGRKEGIREKGRETIGKAPSRKLKAWIDRIT